MVQIDENYYVRTPYATIKPLKRMEPRVSAKILRTSSMLKRLWLLHLSKCFKCKKSTGVNEHMELLIANSVRAVRETAARWICEREEAIHDCQ